MNLVDLDINFYFPYEIERIRNLFTNNNDSPLEFSGFFESKGIFFDENTKESSLFSQLDERHILFDSKKNGLEFDLIDFDRTAESGEDLKLIKEAEKISAIRTQSQLFFVSNVSQDLNKLISYEKKLVKFAREEIANISQFLVSKEIPFYLLNQNSGTSNNLESEILVLFNPEINFFRYKVLNEKGVELIRQELPPKKERLDVYQ